MKMLPLDRRHVCPGYDMVRVDREGPALWAVECLGMCSAAGAPHYITDRPGEVGLVQTEEEALEVAEAHRIRRETAGKLQRAIDASGLSARKFATSMLLRNERSIRRWLALEHPIPREVRVWLDAGAGGAPPATVEAGQ